MRLPAALISVNLPAKHFLFVKGTLNKKPTSSDKTQALLCPPGAGFLLLLSSSVINRAETRHSGRFSLHRTGVIRPDKMKKGFSKKEIFLKILLRTPPTKAKQGHKRIMDSRRTKRIPPNFCALAVMTKAPRAGHVKTRLSPPLTMAEAAALNTCFLRDTMRAISIAAKGIARGIAVYTPVDAAADYAGILPTEFDLIPQRGETLSERLVFAMEDLFRLGFASACLINSDSPTVPEQFFAEAATVLAQPEETLVLGPASDGGYYLIGLKKLHRALFENISWSTETVLQQTLESAGQLKLKIHFLPTWYDVDDRNTLHQLCEEFFGSPAVGASGYPAPATRDYLEALLKREGRERIWPPAAP